ncbi:MAG: hypothetical protein ACI9CF_000181 [Candidatus Omnitrophota bacterium]|jgi:hypothetical protein
MLNRQNSQIFALRVCICIGLMCMLYFNFYKLSGVVITHSDENRAFHFQLFAPLIYFVNKPLITYFNSFDAAYYLQGFVGCMNIILIYGVGRRYFSKAIGLITASFYLFYDYQLAFVKMLYYSNYMVFLCLISILLCRIALNRRSYVISFLAGTPLALMFFSHPAAFAPISMLFIFMILAIYVERDEIGFRGIWLLSLFGLGALSALVSLEALNLYYQTYILKVDAMPYLLDIFQFKTITQGFESKNSTQQIIQFANTYGRALFWTSALVTFRNTMILFCFVFALVSAICRRQRNMLLFLSLALSGITVWIMAMYLLDMPIFRRSLVWMSIPISFSFAYTVQRLWCLGIKALKLAMLIILAIYFMSAAWQCHLITQELWTMQPIEKYLDQRGISKKDIVSDFPLFRRQDITNKNIPRGVPKKTTTVQLNGADELKYHLDWQKIYAMYKYGMISHYLSTSLGALLDFYHDDPLLNRVEPMMEWKHPHDTPYINMLGRPGQKIKLYDLDEVFAPVNALADKKAQ